MARDCDPHVPQSLPSAQRDPLAPRRAHGWPTVADAESAQDSAQTFVRLFFHYYRRSCTY
ncbi:hypothetical protein EXIGLDRAFT_733337 [Exidia glandulosa HHB12029]|uniref:Uncharacterized protein n=1 Tax=Exidia glandulosa HHB12029 TaxID=1314781 RepID=A0A166AZ15_EXIGL|nr:hypothetical protein EXIGLDRAFT_733337 [Exidia glandulosa HHB12029]